MRRNSSWGRTARQPIQVRCGGDGSAGVIRLRRRFIGGLGVALGVGIPFGLTLARRFRFGLCFSCGLSFGLCRALGPLFGRDGRAAVGGLPHLLAALGVDDPFALGPFLALIGGFLGQLGLALDVDAPTGEASGEAGVLALLADCLLYTSPSPRDS